MKSIKSFLKNKSGFTITELVCVIAVIAILAGMMIPSFTSATTKSEADAAEAYSRLNEANAPESRPTLNPDAGATITVPEGGVVPTVDITGPSGQPGSESGSQPSTAPTTPEIPRTGTIKLKNHEGEEAEFTTFSDALKSPLFKSGKKSNFNHSIDTCDYTELSLETDIEEDISISNTTSDGKPLAVKIYLNGHTIKGSIEVSGIANIYGGSKADPYGKTAIIDASDKLIGISFFENSLVGEIANVHVTAKKYGFFMLGTTLLNDGKLKNCIFNANTNEQNSAGIFVNKDTFKGSDFRTMENTISTGYYGVRSVNTSFGLVKKCIIIGKQTGLVSAGGTLVGPIKGSIIIGQNQHGIQSGTMGNSIEGLIEGDKEYPCIIIGKVNGIKTTGVTPQLGGAEHSNDLLFICGGDSGSVQSDKLVAYCGKIYSGTFYNKFNCNYSDGVEGGKFINGFSAASDCRVIKGGEFYNNGNTNAPAFAKIITLNQDFIDGFKKATFYSKSITKRAQFQKSGGTELYSHDWTDTQDQTFTYKAYFLRDVPTIGTDGYYQIANSTDVYRTQLMEAKDIYNINVVRDVSITNLYKYTGTISN